MTDFSTIPVDHSWSFSDKTQKDTAWLQRSVKPTRDMNKKIYDPYAHCDNNLRG
jgi:hypothetical protein